MRLLQTALCAAGVLLAAVANAADSSSPSPPRVPVILDTDIGDDIDDTWALGFLLACPELDLRLVVGDYGRPEYRARLLAKFLQTVGRTNVPVGLGVEVAGVGGEEAQADWVKGYELDSYPGRICRDGVQALIETVIQSKEPVTIIAIGPAPNLAAALAREPRIAEKARFVGMHGSVRVGYGGAKKADAEWNVKADPASCEKVFTAAWPVTITPLDTCGLVILDGERYQLLRESSNSVARAILENYAVWAPAKKQPPDITSKRSSTLFDTVAVYLAVSRDFCTMETVGLRVTPEGFTVIDSKAKPVTAATSWKNLDGFRDFLVERLTTGQR